MFQGVEKGCIGNKWVNISFCSATVWLITQVQLNLFQPSVAFHVETIRLICTAKQMTSFYVKINFWWKWVNSENSVISTVTKESNLWDFLEQLLENIRISQLENVYPFFDEEKSRVPSKDNSSVYFQSNFLMVGSLLII